MPERDPEARSRTFDEVTLGYSLSRGAARGRALPAVQPARPASAAARSAIDIPRFIRHLLVKDVDGALGVIREANILPSVCGRVCPQESQCESQCVIARKMEPVAIGRLERFVGDHGKVRHPSRWPPPIGKRVAVVGLRPGGPGLRRRPRPRRCRRHHPRGAARDRRCAALRHPVVPAATRDHRPRDRRAARPRRAHRDRQGGRPHVHRRTTCSTTRGFDAVFLGVGAGAPSFLGIPGENAGRVISANEFLTRVNLMGGDRFPDIDTPVGIGTDVVVIGAGNTAMDCLRVARRLGADVRCVYRRTPRRGAGTGGGAAPRRRRGHRVPVPAQPGRGAHRRAWRACAALRGRADGAGRTRRARAAHADGHRRQSRGGVRHRHRRPGHQPEPDRHPQHGRPRSSTSGATSPPTRSHRRPTCPACSPAATSSPAAPRSSSPWAPAGVRRRRSSNTWTAERSMDTIPTRHRWQHVPALPPPGRRRRRGRHLLRRLRWSPGAAPTARKRSEGFAFPYGRCPACGGTLECSTRRCRRAGSAARCPTTRIEAVRTAFEIELGGRDFYVAAAKHTSDEELHDMFQRLAAMEREHIDTLVRRYHLPAPDDAERRPASRARCRPARSDIPTTRSTCSSWRSPSSNAPKRSSVERLRATPPRRRASSTASSRPRRASTSHCSPPSWPRCASNRRGLL